MGIVTAILSFLGTAVSGLFGMKRDQADVVQAAVASLSSITSADDAQAKASAAAIAAVYDQGGWLERSWRPIFMWCCIGLVVARWFGFVPTQMTLAEADHLYNFLYIGICGYMPLRSFDKWMRGFQIGKILEKFIAKKIL